MYIIIQRQLREGGGSGGRVSDVGYYQLMVQYINIYIYVNSVLQCFAAFLDFSRTIMGPPYMGPPHSGSL